MSGCGFLVFSAGAVPPNGRLAGMLFASAAMFAAAAAVFWIVEKAWCASRRQTSTRPSFPGHEPMTLGKALWFALVRSSWMVPVALGVSFAVTALCTACGIALPKQELVEWFTSGKLAVGEKALVVLYAVAWAPFIEEILFRRFLFRGCRRFMSPKWAIAVSAAIFAAVHLNVAVLLPIFFLGVVFAWIYERTARLPAAMLAHFVFNASNVILMFCFPELV